MAIRHLATSWSGVIAALAEFEHRVHVVDLTTGIHLSTFNTILDFGGRRLSITSDGTNVVAAAYHVEGIAAYSTADGTEIWRRKDLKKAQHIRFSLDDDKIFCGFERKTFAVLRRATGKTITTMRGVKDIWESPFESIRLLEKLTLVLETNDSRKLASIPRATFAVLSAAFAPGLVCVSESTGPVRCLDTSSGQERWRLAIPDQHFLEVAYNENAASFVGVCWPYQRGGPHRLIRFGSNSGAVTELGELGSQSNLNPTTASCLRGSCFLLSDGRVVDSPSVGAFGNCQGCDSERHLELVLALVEVVVVVLALVVLGHVLQHPERPSFFHRHIE